MWELKGVGSERERATINNQIMYADVGLEKSSEYSYSLGLSGRNRNGQGFGFIIAPITISADDIYDALEQVNDIYRTETERLIDAYEDAMSRLSVPRKSMRMRVRRRSTGGKVYRHRSRSARRSYHSNTCRLKQYMFGNPTVKSR